MGLIKSHLEALLVVNFHFSHACMSMANFEHAGEVVKTILSINV